MDKQQKADFLRRGLRKKMKLEEKKERDPDQELAQWKDGEQKARRKDMEEPCPPDKRDIKVTRNFFLRNSDRFVYLPGTQHTKPLKVAAEDFGCETLSLKDEDGCVQCDSEFNSLGQLCDMSLDPTRIPPCFNPGKLVFHRKRTKAILLLPVLPEVQFDIEDVPFFIREELSNPDGITLMDIYRGTQKIMETPLSDPKLNVCIRQILPFLDEGRKNELTVHEADKDKQHGEVVRFLDKDGKLVKRLADISFYSKCQPISIVAFTAFAGEAFVEIEF